MEMEMEPRSVPRRDGRKLSRCPRMQMNVKTASAIEQATGASIVDVDGGTMRVKIVLSKHQLKQMAAAVAGGRGNVSFALPPPLEQLVQVLKRQHAKKQAAEVAVGLRLGRWSPALESIPEECYG